MTTVYCFINTVVELGANNLFARDVIAVAVCGACGDIITSHMSSNADYGRYDIQRPFHVERCELHVKQQHDSADKRVEMVWLDHPEESAELRALEGKVTSQTTERP